MDDSFLAGTQVIAEHAGAAAARNRLASLARDAASLKQLAATFERWHQDMITAMTHNRELNQKGEALSQNARELLMLSINAAI